MPRLNKLRFFQDLGYEPHPGQVPVHLSQAPRRVLACGVRWGKSTCAAMEAIAALVEPCERSLGWVVAPTYDLSDRIFRSIQEVLDQHLEHRVVELDARGRRVVIRNLGGGLSELKGKSADHSVSLLGEALDWVVVEEAARLKAAVWESHLSQRLIDRRGWALLISTPRGKDWFYDEFRRAKSDPEVEAWNLPSTTNPLLSGEVVERERQRLPDQVFRQEYLAEFIGPDPNQCDVCGDPRPEALGIVVAEEGEPMPECPECGAPVDTEGRALRTVLAGKPHLQVIHLCEGEAKHLAESSLMESPA